MTRIRNGAAWTLAAMLVAALGAAAPVTAQTTTDGGVWTAVTLRSRVSADGGWRWTADSLVRSRDGVQTLDFALEQITVSRDVTPHVGVGFGYAFDAGFLDSGTLLEHRFTQHVTWSGGRRTRVSLRNLLEERFITRHPMLLRARHQARVAWPLASQGRLRGVIWEEVLVQADSRSLASPRLDSNRVFVGLGKTLTPRSAMEVGYLNSYSVAGANRRQRTHILAASLAVSM